MDSPPQDAHAVCALVFLLGAQHGFDADHLAVIDGLTRANQSLGRTWARYCGTFFSLGHGAVVVIAALCFATVARQSVIPHWLDAFGTATSIGVLMALAMINLRSALASSTHETDRPGGLLARIVRARARAGSRTAVAAIGALFAISFDTLSQTALFALAAVASDGIARVLLLALLFLGGMLITDGINGLWVARLIHRTSRMARIASRTMGVAVSCASLLTAALALARLRLPVFAGWSEAHELVFGGAVLALVGMGYLIARALGARSPCDDRFRAGSRPPDSLAGAMFRGTMHRGE